MSNSKMTILMGASGSGKSTWAARQRAEEGYPVTVLSADAYFVGADGEYRFDIGKLSDAHAWCFRTAMQMVLRPSSRPFHLIVDNTNTTASEISPYLMLARAYDLEVEIRAFDQDPEVCARQNIHGVPEAAVRAQYARLLDTVAHWPPFFPSPFFQDVGVAS